jgi:hypothetical protein
MQAGQSGAPGTAGAAGATPQQVNMAQRQSVLNSSVDMLQQVQAATPANLTQTGGAIPVNIQPRNVGLIKRFIIEVTGTINNTDAADALTLTDFGFANFFSQISFIDLNNNTRIQTTGWHLYSIWAAKHKWPYGVLAAQNNVNSSELVMFGMGGDNFGVVSCPQSVAHGASTNFRFYLEVPLAYSDNDLRGAIDANVVNATMQLQLTLNGGAIVAPATDSTNAVYKGATGYSSTTSNFSNIQINVYQHYLDQLPVSSKGGPILPTLDLSTIYEIKNTTFSSIVANNDFPIPYANFRDFLSTFAVFNNNPAADAGRVGGTDTNYWALQSANFTNLFKYDPYVAALMSRRLTNLDWPKGMYYFSSRGKPINTTQYGNMQLILNANSASAGAYVLVGWEDFALVNTLTQASSLPAS